MTQSSKWRSIPQLFDEVYRRHGGAEALVWGVGGACTTSFSELHGCVGKIVAALGDLSLDRGDLIGVHCDRGPFLVATLLALWHLGLVYVPIDKAFPGPYRRTLAQRADVKVIVHDGGAEALFSGPTLLSVEQMMSYGAPEALVLEGDALDAPALLMFTSGSSGRPKGVLHTQGQVLNRLLWMWDRFPARTDDVASVRSSMGVMPSMWELLGGLLLGLKTVVIPRDFFHDFGSFFAFLEAHKVTWITLTPSLLRLLFHPKRASVFLNDLYLRRVTVGGEMLRQSDVDDFHTLFPGVMLLEDYGATEVNTIGFGVRVPGEEHWFEPISNVGVEILGDDLAPVETGCEGEICVSGRGLALGYHRWPEQTARQFVQLETGTVEGRRVYRTGDYGIRDAQGRFWLKGRRDDQVKINGQRVDLSQVEGFLCAQREICEAVVTYRIAPEGRGEIVAWYSENKGASVSPRGLRERLRSQMPSIWVPHRMIRLDALPRLVNGKIDRRALAERANHGELEGVSSRDVHGAEPMDEVCVKIARTVQAILGRTLSKGEWHGTWSDLGFDSLTLVELKEALGAEGGWDLEMADFFTHLNIPGLSAHLERGGGGMASGVACPALRTEGLETEIDGIAVIAMAGEFPGAQSIQALWRMIVRGEGAISEIPQDRWSMEGFYGGEGAGTDRSVSKWGGFLADPFSFAPSCYGITEHDALHLDPQHRLCLRAVRQVLQGAGYRVADLAGHGVGVFIGARPSGYPHLLKRAGKDTGTAAFLGNDTALMAGRISHFLGVHGPCLVVDTACSSSMVALHLACASLRQGEASMALVGGVSVIFDPAFYIHTSGLGVFSPTGQCRPFDEAADGFVHGEGVAFVLLKRLSQAMRDGDHIHGVITASALNHDGRSNSLTAPNGRAQAMLLRDVLEKARACPETIGYVQAHGTGTQLGDPVEAAALLEVFGPFKRGAPCAVGSVKANIGHLTAAAGVTSVITALCAIETGLIPPQRQYTSLNRHIHPRFLDTFDVPTQSRVWTAPVRRACVSAFGLSGTNGACVVEAFDPPSSVPKRRHHGRVEGPFIVAVTAPNPTSLVQYLRGLGAYLERCAAPLCAIAYTLAHREMEACGWVFCVSSLEALRADLSCAEERSHGIEGGLHALEEGDIALQSVLARVRARGNDALLEAFEGLDLGKIPLPVSQDFGEDYRPGVGEEVAAVSPIVVRTEKPNGGDVDDEILEVLETITGIDRKTSLREERIGGEELDSLKRLSLKDALYDRFSVEISLSDLYDGMTFGELRDRIGSQGMARQGEGRFRREDAFGEGAPRIQGPWPLTDLQASHLVAKLSGQGMDGVGSCVYLRFVLSNPCVDRLQGAWDTLVRAHPLLRVRITGQGKQIVVEGEDGDRSPFLTSEEVGGHRDGVRGALMERVYRAGAYPLYGIYVATMDDGQAMVHMHMDASVIDGHSAQIVLEQWYRLYHDPDHVLDLPRIGFFDALAHHARVGKEDRRAQDYWIDKLKSPWHPACLPRAPAAIEQNDGHPSWFFRAQTVLPRATFARLKTLFKAAGVRVLNGMFAVFLDWLSHSQGKTPFAVLMTLKNRPPIHPDIDKVVGPFTSSLLFMAEIRQRQSFVDFAKTVQQTLDRDLEHSQVSAVWALRASQRTDRVPIVYSALRRPPPQQSFMGALQEELGMTTGVWLHCHGVEQGEDFFLEWDCDPRFLPKPWAEHLLCDLVQWYEQISQDGQIPHTQDAVSPRRSACVPSRAPLTTLMRSYLAQGFMAPNAVPSHVIRTYDVSHLSSDRLRLAAQALEARHGICGVEISPKGQVFCPERARSYPPFWPPWAASDEDDLETACREGERHVIEALRQRGGPWPGYVLAPMVHRGHRFLQFFFNCLSFDGFSTLKFPDELGKSARLGGEEEGCEPVSFAAALEYALFQQSLSAGNIGKVGARYWTEKLAALFPRENQVLPVLPCAKKTLRAEWVGFDALVCVAQGQGVGVDALLIGALKDVVPQGDIVGERTPLLIVEYGHRRLRKGWASALGDFSSFCVVPSGPMSCTDIQGVLNRDRANGFCAIFSCLPSTVPPRPGVFPLVFTNALDVDVGQGAQTPCVYTNSHTQGVVLDCFVYRSGQKLCVEWTFPLGGECAQVAPRVFADFMERVEGVVRGEGRRDGGRAAQTDHPDPQALLVALNQTEVAFRRECTLVRLFDEAVLQAPLSPASIDEGEVLTYGQLQALSCRYARHFQEKWGMGAGDSVAVKMGRSGRMLAVLYGILRLGAAFVPLNEDDGVERQEKMLRRAKATFVVGEDALIAPLTDQGIQKVPVEAFLQGQGWEDVEGEIDHVIDHSRADGLAYVIFTSGSTGEPKGVMVPHRPVVNLIEWAKTAYGFDGADRVLWVNALGFDLSIFDIFGFLAYGASIRVLSNAQRKDALAITKILCREPITFWNSAPAYFQMIMPFLKKEDTVKDVGLTVIFLSGDWIPLSLVDEILAHLPNTQLVCLGRATEATVWSNYFNVTHKDPSWESVPYGRPIQNARYYILDAEGSPCGVHEPGRLFIAGECLSSGYINAEDLTARAFVKDPFWPLCDARMYDTGDRARYGADGQIIFLGREDTQVKIRGYRVELGEITAALAATGFCDPIVISDTRTSSSRLIAFCRAAPQGSLRVLPEHRAELAQKLPDYMVPSQIIVIQDPYPMTENGKIDHTALRQKADEIFQKEAP